MRRGRRIRGTSGSREGFISICGCFCFCFCFPAKKRSEHSLISEVKRAEKEEDIGAEDLEGMMVDEVRSQRRGGEKGKNRCK